MHDAGACVNVQKVSERFGAFTVLLVEKEKTTFNKTINRNILKDQSHFEEIQCRLEFSFTTQSSL